MAYQDRRLTEPLPRPGIICRLPGQRTFFGVLRAQLQGATVRVNQQAPAEGRER